MSNYSTSEFKSGLKIMVSGDPHTIVENEFVKPGKGQAFSRVKLRNLKTQTIIERTFKSGESFAAADVVECLVQFLYKDAEYWHFMDKNNYEQYSANAAAVGDASKWLSEEAECMMTLYAGAPLLLQPPHFVKLEVTATEPGVRGDTATSGSKPATLSTGAVIKVPLFVNQNDFIDVDTRTGEYQGRSKS